MCTHICIHMYTCTNKYIHLYLSIGCCMCIHIYMNIYMYTYTILSMYVSLCMHTRV